jgi:hypothetical protein
VSICRPSLRDEIEKVQQEIRQIETSRRAIKDEQTKSAKSVSLVDSFRQEYMKKATVGKRAKPSEESLLAQLESFKTKLVDGSTKGKPIDKKPVWVCELHGIDNCKSCREYVHRFLDLILRCCALNR